MLLGPSDSLSCLLNLHSLLPCEKLPKAGKLNELKYRLFFWSFLAALDTMWIGAKPWQSKTSSHKMDTSLSMLKTEARTEITKNCNSFWMLLMIGRSWLTMCCFRKRYRTFSPPLLCPLLLLCASTSLPVAKWCWFSSSCSSALQFAM